MKDQIGNLTVDALRARLELSWIAAAALMDDLEFSFLTDDAKSAVSRRWQEVTRDGDILAFALDLIRRQQRRIG